MTLAFLPGLDSATPARSSAGRHVALRRHRVPPLLAVLTLVLPFGCATAPPPPPAAVRAPLGTIGVVGGVSVASPSIAQPWGKGAQVTAGGWAGALYGTALGAMEAASTSPPLNLLLVPLGAVVGGIMGVVDGSAAAAGAEATAPLRETLGNVPVGDTLAQEVYRALQGQTGHQVVWVPAPPLAPADSGDAILPTLPCTMDTLLDVRVLTVALHSSGPRAWVLTPVLTARTRLVRVQDGAELHAREWVERGGYAALPIWAEDDAKPLRDAFAHMTRRLAARIVDEVFGTPRAGSPSASREDVAPE